MRCHRYNFDGKVLLLFALATSPGVVFGPGRLQAEPDLAAQKNLQLEVIINNVPANLISSFVLFPDGSMGATPSELEELGLHTGLRRSATEVIMLNDIPSLKYEYQERTQKLLITIDNALRRGQTFDLRREGSAGLVRPSPGWGTVLNYDLFSTTSGFQDLRLSTFSGTSLTLNARAFSPYGILEQSAIAVSTQTREVGLIRLNTSYRYSDPDSLISWTAGDTVNGGLPWSRPIRIGGLQAQSNFVLRPDLITMPLPSLGGIAAVPSTVDLYVNNIKTFSQEVAPGPFSVSNIPLVTGAGNAQLVLRDSSGQQTRTSLPFYASANLLAPGLSAWSVEAGFPRLSYGSATDTYVEVPVASATLRRGIYDWLTLEGHAEGGGGIANGGAGAAFKTGSFGVAAGAVAASAMSDNTGFQTYASYETHLFGLNINASSQRTFGSYEDLASATARLQNLTTAPVPTLYGFLTYTPSVSPTPLNANLYTNAHAPRALDRFTVGAPLPFDEKASLSLSYMHLLDATGNLSNLVTASYARSLPYNASMFATAFRDFGTAKNTGFVVGLSIPFSDSVSTSSDVSRSQGGTTVTAEAMTPLGPKAGDFGWRVRDSEGAVPYREATMSYRSSYGMLQVGANRNQTTTSGLLELRGAITSMAGDVFFSDRIDDAFAVVDAGAPGVEVSNENHPIGVTDSKGLLLVPTLRSYQKNNITVDPSSLPVDAELEKTREVAAPADRSGILVSFKVHNDTTAALVVFIRSDGSFVPAGSAGQIDGGDEFVVGYDGQAYIKNLSAANAATVELANATCHASFNFVPRPGEQVRIDPVMCR